MPPITAKDDAMTRTNTSSRRETPAEWLGIPELAQMLSVSEDFIRAQVHQRKIPYYKVVGFCDSARELAGDRAPTADDVPITRDGRRLDTPDKVRAFIAQINADRAAGRAG